MKPTNAAVVKPSLSIAVVARALPLIGAVTALLGGGVLLLQSAGAQWREIAATGGQELSPLVEASACVALGLVLAWLSGVTALCVVQVLRGRPRPQVAPRLIYRLVCLVLGVGLGLTPVAASAASDAAAPAARGTSVSLSTDSTPTATATASPSASLDPGWGSSAGQPQSSPTTAPQADNPWFPTAPQSTGSGGPSGADPSSSGSGNSGPQAGSATDGGTDRSVLVRRGDSLWEIAARDLGAEASTAEIAAEWPRWYQANRALIGSDPNLITPGQELQRPG